MAAWKDTAYPADQAELYRLMDAQLGALMEGERDALPNMANASALIYHALENVNWAGFYLYRQGMLVLGPFQGKPACIRIPLGRGVCGTAAQSRRTQLVANVHDFPGHIACDADSQSEIVIPLIQGGRLLGVLDLDSPIPSRFTENDRAGLEELAKRLVNGCDWPA
ncbi:MAG: GAF domain-containing protein [Eubacteriales bacterium]|nr:GAF domain-containing protein [Eubacteriales bacterium]MDY4007732.1 GAF domain-containing protein [Candidatus Limiplasma sp.]